MGGPALTAKEHSRHGPVHRPRGPDPGFHPVRLIKAVIGNSVDPITAGIGGDTYVDFKGELLAWALLADQTGDVIVDLWVDDLGSYPPTIADTIIVGGTQPTLSGQGAAFSDDMTDWVVGLERGDTIRYHIDSVATITRLTIVLTVLPLLDSAVPPGGY